MKKHLGAQTLVYPTPVFVVGSYSPNGQPNAMTAAWGGICCSDPPSVAVSIRKARQTYANVMEHKAFTINIPSEAHAREADYLGIVSGKHADKLKVAGLTTRKSELVNAPIINEFPLVLECRLLHTFELGAHTQFVGEILDVKAEEAVLGKDGGPDITKVKPLVWAPDKSMGYYSVGAFVARGFSAGRELKK